MLIRRIYNMILTVLALLCNLSYELEASYTAAVYEYTPRDPLGILGQNGVKENLAAFEGATKIAADRGADIIVFPEYGIIPQRGRREKISPFLEYVPDPREGSWNPCLQRDIFKDRNILTNLSCIARSNNITVVANMGSKETCESKGCPTDNLYHFNTNVVFNRNGTLIARYYKKHLYLEDSYNEPPKTEIITFDTDVGRFGTITCFDILFREAVDLVKDYGVDAIAYPTWWSDTHPFLSSIQFQEGWAIRHNVTLLAANIHIPLLGSTGSGIYTGKGATVYTHAEDPTSKILISKIDDPHTAYVITQNVSYNLLPSKYRYKRFNLVNYTLSEIVNGSGELSACNGGLCCKLVYRRRASVLAERYYLAVFNGTRTDPPNRYRWCEESCTLIRCEDRFRKHCGDFPVKSTTVFSDFNLSGNFTTSEYVYPSVLLSEMKLLPTSYWTHEMLNDSIVLKSTRPVVSSVLTVGLYGRCYDKDPVYNPY